MTFKCIMRHQCIRLYNAWLQCHMSHLLHRCKEKIILLLFRLPLYRGIMMPWCHSSGTTSSFQTRVTILCSVCRASLPEFHQKLKIVYYQQSELVLFPCTPVLLAVILTQSALKQFECNIMWLNKSINIILQRHNKLAPSSPTAQWFFPRAHGRRRLGSASFSTDGRCWHSHSHNMSICGRRSVTSPLPVVFCTAPKKHGSDSNVEHFLEVVLSQCRALDVWLSANAPCSRFALGLRDRPLTIFRQLYQHLQHSS